MRQVIPPFSLWWVAMVHDYAMWRNDPEFVRERMPGVRGVLESFRQHVDTPRLAWPDARLELWRLGESVDQTAFRPMAGTASAACSTGNSRWS